jgi:hypothetical protein
MAARPIVEMLLNEHHRPQIEAKLRTVDEWRQGQSEAFAAQEAVKSPRSAEKKGSPVADSTDDRSGYSRVLDIGVVFPESVSAALKASLENVSNCNEAIQAMMPVIYETLSDLFVTENGAKQFDPALRELLFPGHADDLVFQNEHTPDLVFGLYMKMVQDVAIKLYEYDLNMAKSFGKYAVMAWQDIKSYAAPIARNGSPFDPKIIKRECDPLTLPHLMRNIKMRHASDKNYSSEKRNALSQLESRLNEQQNERGFDEMKAFVSLTDKDPLPRGHFWEGIEYEVKKAGFKVLIQEGLRSPRALTMLCEFEHRGLDLEQIAGVKLDGEAGFALVKEKFSKGDLEASRQYLRILSAKDTGISDLSSEDEGLSSDSTSDSEAGAQALMLSRLGEDAMSLLEKRGNLAHAGRRSSLPEETEGKAAPAKAVLDVHDSEEEASDDEADSNEEDQSPRPGSS